MLLSLPRMELLTHMQLLRLHVRPCMPHAIAVHAQPPPHAGVPTHVVVGLVLADMHAGGDHPRPLRLPRTWGPLRPQGPPLHALASCAC
jgi:hypothetical protein